MSHITEVKMKIRDLDALREAAEALGLVFMEGQKTHEWYGTFVGDSREGRDFARDRGVASMGKCEHALRLKDHKNGDYEIGIVPALDGDGYSLAYDSWGTHGARLHAAAGDNLNTLRREYSVSVATREARKRLGRDGWRVQRQDLDNGKVRLRLRRR